jgi:thymidylate synthase (FAD)
MNVKLISFSQQPPEEFRNADAPDMESIKDLIAYCARVSNPSNQSNMNTAEKLIRYLIAHKHWSPMEMVSMCLEVETTRDIARQILRHRSFSFQEYSQRYADPTKDLEFVVRDARLQDHKNRQNSITLDLDDQHHREINEIFRMKQLAHIRNSEEIYNWAIENHIAKEQARVVLPEGNTVSRMYVNGTLRSWIHFIELRSGVETQLEHRDIALACASVIKQVFFMIDEFVQK